MFDQAKLAVVAYAAVNGFDGSSTLTNSGIVTTRVSQGYYALSLPTGAANGQTLQQIAASDIVIVTPTSTVSTVITPNCLVVNNEDSTTKYVLIGTAGASAVDCNFSVVILRSLMPQQGTTVPY
jgi:hypothetical protein